jgi:hypothetical protein
LGFRVIAGAVEDLEKGYPFACMRGDIGRAKGLTVEEGKQ